MASFDEEQLEISFDGGKHYRPVEPLSLFESLDDASTVIAVVTRASEARRPRPKLARASQ